MAIFGNKKKGAEPESTPAAPVVGGNNKSKNSMNEFFDISVTESALEVFDTNKNYFGGDKRDGTAYYIGMMLHTDDIGGFSKKTKNDPDKGSLVEAVRGGNIDAYVTPEQNDSGELIFIPTEKTFSYAGEFSMLTDAEYEVVKIDTRSGEVIKTGKKLPYRTFKRPLDDAEAISSLIGETDSQPAQAVPVPVPQPASVPVSKPVSTPAPVVQTAPVPEAGIANIPTASPPAAGRYQSAPVAAAEADESEDEDLDEELEEDNGDPADTVYTEADVVTAVTRKYYSEGLNLEVSSEPFEQMFVAGNRQILFDEKQKDGFVDGELNRMAKNANIEIQRLRQKRMQEMREYFLMVASDGALGVQKQHDMHNAGTDCGRQKIDLDRQRKDKVENLDGLVSEKRAEIEREFEKHKKIAMDEGARKAGLEFNTKFGRLHSDKLERLPDRIRETIESDYNRDLREIFYTRQDRAMTSYDFMTTELLKTISRSMFVELGKEEDALYAKHIRALDDYAATLYKDDARRTMIEEERLRVQRDVAEARDEMSSKMQALTDSHEAMKRSMEAEHEAAVALLESKNKALKTQMDERVSVLEKDRAELTENLEDMRKLYAEAGEEAKAEYRSQIADAKFNVEQWAEMTKSLEAQYKHNSRIAVVVTVAVVLAALAIGFTIGGIWYFRQDRNTDNTAIMTDYVQGENRSVTTDISEDSEPAETSAPENGAEAVTVPDAEVSVIPGVTSAPEEATTARTARTTRVTRVTSAARGSDAEPAPVPAA